MGLAGSGAEPGLVSRIWPHLGAAWGGIREGKVPVPTLVRKGAPWYLLHGMLGVEGMGMEGFGKWVFPREGSAHPSVTIISPSTHPPKVFLHQGSRYSPKQQPPSSQGSNPLQRCPSWSSGIQTIPMGPRRGPQGWKEPLGAEQVSRGAGGSSPSDGPTVVVAFCWSGACKG